MLGRYAFFIQSFIWIAPIIGSYIAYRQVRAGKKLKLAREDLMKIGITDSTGELTKELEKEYSAGDYLWPIFYASALTIVVYSMTHPAVIQTELWTGVLENSVAIFVDENTPANINPGNSNFLSQAVTNFRSNLSEAAQQQDLILMTRALFWVWLGAYIYGFNIIWRRFMSYDLTPSVYIFVATRMALAFAFGGIVVISVGLTPDLIVNDTNNVARATFVITFVVGFFPERGIDWITATFRRITGDSNRLAKETRLSHIEGLSVWHQGRLKQQDIENVQNLANADIPLLVVTTPFGVAQIIDWVDQAILLLYANDDIYPQLEAAGIRCASDYLTSTETQEDINMLAATSGVKPEHLHLLRMSIESASNSQITTYYRWRASTNPERIQKAKQLLENRIDRHLQVLKTAEIKVLEEFRRRQEQLPASTMGEGRVDV